MHIEHETMLERALKALKELATICYPKGPLYRGGHLKEAAEVARGVSSAIGAIEKRLAVEKSASKPAKAVKPAKCATCEDRAWVYDEDLGDNKTCPDCGGEGDRFFREGRS